MAESQTEPIVYLRGQLVPASQAHIAIYDAGIILGATVTDMARTFKQQLFRLEDHVARFYRSCKYARIAPPVSPEETLRLSREVVGRNAALLPPGRELAMVWFITPGELTLYAGAAGLPGPLASTYCIHTFPLPFHLWRRHYQQGAHVVTPSIRHVPPQCTDPKIKCRSRMHWWLADQETHLVDREAISLCLDLEGNVTETSGSNFLIVQGGAVVQPSPRNILAGVSQQTVRELCRKLAIPYEIRDFQVHDVITADEAFLASTPYCLAPVTRINGITIGDGRPGGPVFRKLIAAWSDLVGLDIVGQIMEE
jgi:branched-subunit amino acid aminotransferase/4-amino-4-deoxychorismate lyase